MNISQALANKGRFGDTMVAHLSPREAMMLKAMGGAGTRNPKTGLPEFFNNADFLASLGSGELGYEEFINSLGTSVPDTSVSTSTIQAPTIVPTSEYINATIGGGSISPEGGQSVYDVAPTTLSYSDAEGAQQQVTYTPSDVTGFDASAYYKANPDVEAAGVDALQHYMTYGKNEGRGWGTENIYSPTYNPQKKYEYQPSKDQTWAVPGLKEEKPGDQLYTGSPETGDMSMYQRDETGKPTTSNYKYFSSGDDLYGAGVSKVYQDPTKYYTDMPDAGNYRLVTNADNSVSYIDYTGDSDLYSDDKGIYYTNENGKKTYVNKYNVTGDKVTIGGKTYSVTKGDETKYSTKIATTADLADPDYSGKYQDLGNVYTQSEWQDVQNGYGWKYRYVNGQIYYAMPGDDITKTGYTGLTQDQVNNAYTYKGENYSNLNQEAYEHEKYGTYDPGTYENSAWAYDEATGNYYRPVFTGNDVMMKRMLRPGEDSGDSGGLLNIVKYVLPTAVTTLMSMGMGSSILGELAATVGQVGSMAGDAYFAGAGGGGAGLGASAGTAAVPTFTEGIKSGLSSIGDYLASIPSSISSGLSNLSWSSLAPSSLKAVAIPAAVGAGYSGMQSDWDLMEMLKGAGMGALGGYGMDRLLAGLKYLGGGEGGVYKNDITGNYNPEHGSYISEHPSELLGNQGIDAYGNIVNSGRSYDPTLTEVYNYKNDITGNYNPNHSAYISEHPTEILANQGLDPKFGVPVTDNVAYDPTLIQDRPIYAGDNGKFYLDNFDFPNVTEQWINENTPFYAADTPPTQKPIYQGPDGKFYLDNWDFPDVTEDWITQNTPFYNVNGEWYMDNFDFPNYSTDLVEGGGREWFMDNFDNPGYSVEDPFGKNWNIDWSQYDGGPVGNAKYTDKDWSQYDGGPIGYESTPWDYISSAGATFADILPLIPKILGTGGTSGSGTEGTEFPSGSGSASGGYGYTTADTSSSEGTGGAGRESALAKAKAIAALQAIKDSVNKKFSGQLYYT